MRLTLWRWRAIFTRRTLSVPASVENYARWEDTMLQAHSTLRAFLKKYVLTSVSAVAPVLLAGSAGADDSRRVKTEPAVRLLDAVPVPVSAANSTSGAMYSFDISWVDQ